MWLENGLIGLISSIISPIKGANLTYYIFSKASYNIWWWKFRHHFHRLYIQIIYCFIRIIKCLFWITIEFMIPCIDASHRYHKFVTIKCYVLCVCYFHVIFKQAITYTPCNIIIDFLLLYKFLLVFYFFGAFSPLFPHQIISLSNFLRFFILYILCVRIKLFL